MPEIIDDCCIKLSVSDHSYSHNPCLSILTSSTKYRERRSTPGSPRSCPSHLPVENPNRKPLVSTSKPQNTACGVPIPFIPCYASRLRTAHPSHMQNVLWVYLVRLVLALPTKCHASDVLSSNHRSQRNENSLMPSGALELRSVIRALKLRRQTSPRAQIPKAFVQVVDGS